MTKKMLIKLLLKYGNHRNCDVYTRDYMGCDCGWDNVKKEIETYIGHGKGSCIR